MSASIVMDAVLGTWSICNSSQFFRDKYADLFGIISDLEALLIQDDRALQNTRILLDESDQLIGCHRVDVDMILLDDLGPLGDDIIAAVLTAHQQMLDLIVIQKGLEDVFLNERKIPVFEPLFHFSAAGASR